MEASLRFEIPARVRPAFADSGQLLPPRDQVKPTGEFPLFQIVAEERRQFVERNEVHAIVKVHVAALGTMSSSLGSAARL